MEPKEWLKRYAPLYRETTALMKRLNALEESECIADPSEPAEIETRCKQNLEEMAAIRAAISMLDDPLECEVLRLRYTDNTDATRPKWKDIAMEIYGRGDEGGIQNAERLHNRAIKHLAQQKGGTAH